MCILSVSVFSNPHENILKALPLLDSRLLQRKNALGQFTEQGTEQKKKLK